MTDIPGLTGEASNSKVAALFDEHDAARAAAVDVQDALGLSEGQVQVVTPGDVRPGRKLEPESHGIWRTAIRAHAWLGASGLVLGIALFCVMWLMGVPFVVNAALPALFACVFFGGTAGLLLGGLLTLRPDQDLYLIKVRTALDAGRCAVVVHAFNREQAALARTRLEAHSSEVVSTL